MTSLRLNFFILSLLFVFTSRSFAAPAELEITALDTGYADCFVIQSPDGKNILLDSGDTEKPDLPADFLKQKGISRLDLIILSHPHKNHFGAMFRVLKEIEVREIVWNGDTHQEDPFSSLLALIKEKKIPLRALKAGDKLKISGDLEFTVFHPAGDMTENINNNALVLRMVYGKTSALFTTDVGYGVQNDLIKKYGKKLVSDIVQVPHHGGPVSEKFIKFFKPDFFVLSTGPNEWGQPREDQMTRLQSPVLRTDKDGNIIFRSDGKKIQRVI